MVRTRKAFNCKAEGCGAEFHHDPGVKSSYCPEHRGQYHHGRRRASLLVQRQCAGPGCEVMMEFPERLIRYGKGRRFHERECYYAARRGTPIRQSQ